MVKCVLIISLLFSSFTALGKTKQAEAIKEIIWLQSYTPPFHITKSDKAPQGGLCDNLTEQLINTITDVKHTRLVVPQQRINKYLNEGKNVCFPCVIYKEKSSDIFKFSNPTTVYPPFSVLTTTELAPKLTKKHGSPISLMNLLADQHYVYGQAAARKFSNRIDTLIKNIMHDNSSSFSWSSENESQAVIARLSRGFLDYSIDYPFMADYFNKQGRFNNITSIPLAEEETGFIRGAIGCAVKAKNNFASQAIKKINNVLKATILQSPEYIKSQHAFLNPSFADFNKHYQQQVINFKLPATDAQSNTVH
jgi:uncharacterized protein (TIGR02285 family)